MWTSDRKQEIGLGRVLNTHFDHGGIEARTNSAALIANAVVKGANEWPQCVQIVTGDFNSIKSGNKEYDILIQPEIGLVDVASRVSLEGVPRFTLHKFEGLEFESSKGDGTVKLNAATSERADAQH